MSKGSEPAYPCDWEYINSNRSAANGLTKRELFAAMALQGLRAGARSDMPPDSISLAGIAVSDADALLAELEKTK